MSDTRFALLGATLCANKGLRTTSGQQLPSARHRSSRNAWRNLGTFGAPPSTICIVPMHTRKLRLLKQVPMPNNKAHIMPQGTLVGCRTPRAVHKCGLQHQQPTGWARYIGCGCQDPLREQFRELIVPWGNTIPGPPTHPTLLLGVLLNMESNRVNTWYIVILWN